MKGKLKLLWALIVGLTIAMTLPLDAQAPFKVTKLIGDLNDTAESNKAARKELVEMGAQAVPGLIEEIKKYSDLQTSTVKNAARCLRALREMKSDAAVDTAIEMLATLNPKNEPGQHQRVLLSEAIYYLADNFHNAKARDAFYRFVKGSQEKWMHDNGWALLTSDYGSRRVPEHDLFAYVGQLGSVPPNFNADSRPGYSYELRRAWSAVPGKTLGTNIFYGLGKLVERKEPAVGDFLTELLGQLPYKFAVFLEFIDTVDSFSPKTYVFVHNSEKTADFAGSAPEIVFEPKARPRMLVMRWLRDLGHRKAADAIQPLLRSVQKDERDFALFVLEALAGSGPSGTTEATPEEPQPDVVLLRNGDVLTGDILTDTLTIKTSYAELTFKTGEIATVQVETAATRTDLMELCVGDKLSGVIQNAEVKIKLKAGGETTIKKADIDNIRFGRKRRD